MLSATEYLVAVPDRGQVFSVLRTPTDSAEIATLWTLSDLKGPVSARGLPDGHILITEAGGNRVLEVNRDQETVWEYTQGLANPRDAIRLLGTTTIAIAKTMSILTSLS